MAPHSILEGLEEYDEHGNIIHGSLRGLANDEQPQYYSAPNHSHGFGHNHTHEWKTYTNVSPESGWLYYDKYTSQWDNVTDIKLHTGHDGGLFVNDKNLTEAIEDMAFVLKAMAEKYDLKEVKPMIENEAIKAWADAGEKRIIGEVKEKEKHMDDKLFEI